MSWPWDVVDEILVVLTTKAAAENTYYVTQWLTLVINDYDVNVLRNMNIRVVVHFSSQNCVRQTMATR
jgi:hypothetical protein